MSEELVRIDGAAIVLPHSGQVVDPGHAKQCVDALQELRALEQALRQVKTQLTAAIVEESRRQGTKTLHVGNRRVEVRGGKTTLWDAQALEDGLREAGMPEDRISEIVKEEVTYSVKAVEANRAAKANPAYAEVVESAKHIQDTAETVVVTEP